ncbi:ABC transporter permease [Cellulomonas fimi]|uniref:ABC transporter permease n=1 Tax=Cellulomonas fimi TaxID=1708 RepID=UPI00145C4889|nr:sugar ABC transporter permease [Cellulomonas fimi]
MIIPVTVFVALTALCSINGVSLFNTDDSLLLLTRGVATTMLTAMALAINLNSGRFDFSLGSMATLSSVIGATVALNTGGGIVVMAAVTVGSGVLLGVFAGLVYVRLGISPMVCSLGITLLYEGVSFAISGGANVSFLLDTGLTSFSKSPLNMLLVIVAGLAVVFVIFDRSRFGYDYRSLITGQAAAVAAGTNERRNAIGCYAVSGGLMSVVGLIIASQMGYIEAGKLNFGSIGVMFTAFLPMFIGGFIGRFSNDKLGYLLGAFCTTLIGLAFAALRLTSTAQSIANALLLVGFLAYLSNEDRLKRAWRRLAGPPRGTPGPAAPSSPAKPAEVPAVTGASAS